MLALVPLTEKIERHRLELGWTWADLSRKSGLAAATVGKVLRGEAVTVRTAIRLAKALGVKHTSIFSIERRVAVPAETSDAGCHEGAAA